MSDAFDRWVERRHKPPRDRRSIPAELYAAVMSLPEADRSDRQRVNEVVRHHDEARREGRTVWLYIDDYRDGRRRAAGEPGWIKVFESADVAERWFKENDPEGVAWEYEVGGGRARGSVWLYSHDPESRDVGDVDWVRLFASQGCAEKWVEQNDPTGKIWEYPVQE
ncbi:hypothetical protein [Bradyrhizobium canariense]|uniref:hypothetical protein n=1 Tax=Bradyrhizobium canariense TaxID=255045 RepID=UPI001178990D|nr:hypothetical protein [Bradyrhizobium canariense]